MTDAFMNVLSSRWDNIFFSYRIDAAMAQDLYIARVAVMYVYFYLLLSLFSRIQNVVTTWMPCSITCRCACFRSTRTHSSPTHHDVDDGFILTAHRRSWPVTIFWGESTTPRSASRAFP